MRVNLYGTEEQLAIVQCKSRDIGVFAGRRWGKNFGIRNRHITKVLKTGGFQYLHSAPTFAQVQGEWEKLSGHPALRKVIKSSSKKDPYPRIQWINGSESHFRSLDRPDNLRNGEYDEIAVDEIQNVDEDVVEFVLRPMVASRFGTIIVFGQFRGENWYFERFYKPGIDPLNDDVTAWRFPTSSGVVFQSEKGKRELARMRRNIPSMVWDQEYDCLPTANSCGVFRPADIDASMVGGAYVDTGSSSYVIGLDLGMYEDPAAVAVFDCNSSVFCYSKIFQVGQEHAVTAQDVAVISARFGNPTVIMDSTGGATGGHHRHDEFTRHYEKSVPNLRPYHWNQTNKNKMVNKLSLAIEQKRIKIAEENDTLIRQLKTYEYKKTTTGDYKFQGPKGKNDDLVAAALMAYEGFDRGWYKSGSSSQFNNIIGSIGG